MWLTAFLALCFNIVAVLGNLDGFFDEFRQAPETVDCSSQEAETIIDVIAMLQFKVKFALIDEDDLRAHINVESLGDEQDTLDALPYCTIELRERYFGKTTAEDDAYIWNVLNWLKLRLNDLTFHCPLPESKELLYCRELNATVLADAQQDVISVCPNFWSNSTTQGHVHRIEVAIINELLRNGLLAGLGTTLGGEDVFQWELKAQLAALPILGCGIVRPMNYALYIFALLEAYVNDVPAPHPDVVQISLSDQMTFRKSNRAYQLGQIIGTGAVTALAFVVFKAVKSTRLPATREIRRLVEAF